MCRPYGEPLAGGILKLHLCVENRRTLNWFRRTLPYHWPPDGVGLTSFNRDWGQEALGSLRLRRLWARLPIRAAGCRTNLITCAAGFGTVVINRSRHNAYGDPDRLPSLSFTWLKGLKSMQILFQYVKGWRILRLWEISACFFHTAQLLGTLISKVWNVLPVKETPDQDSWSLGLGWWQTRSVSLFKSLPDQLWPPAVLISDTRWHSCNFSGEQLERLWLPSSLNDPGTYQRLLGNNTGSGGLFLLRTLGSVIACNIFPRFFY